MREKSQCYSLEFSAETILLRPGQDVGLNLLRGGEGSRRHSFERDSQKIVIGVGGPQFRLKACTDYVSYTHFSRENVPLKTFLLRVTELLFTFGAT
jgi:hypothetical protein